MAVLKLPAALLCSLALAAGGCGAEPSNQAAQESEAAGAPATAAEARDVCSFVTREEVAAATGERIVEVEAEGDTCSYRTDDPMAASVDIEIKQSGGAEEMEVARRAAGVLGDIGGGMKESGGAEGDAGEAISERAAAPRLGDEAFFGANQQLHVRKDDVYFAVSPPSMRSRMSGGNPLLTPEAKRETATAIAERVLSRL